MARKKIYKILSTNQAYKLVLAESDNLFKQIEKDLDGIAPGQRFILIGRIINLMFGKFYGIALAFGVKEVELYSLKSPKVEP